MSASQQSPIAPSPVAPLRARAGLPAAVLLGLATGCAAPLISADGESTGKYSPCGASDPDCSDQTPTQSGSGLGSGGGGSIRLDEVESSAGEMTYTEPYGCEFVFSSTGTRIEDGWCPDCDLSLRTEYTLVSDTCGYGSLSFTGVLAIRDGDDGLQVWLAYASYYGYYGYDYDDYGYYGAPPPAYGYSYSEMGSGTGTLSSDLLSYALYRESYRYYYDDYGYGYDYATSSSAAEAYSFVGEATLY